MKTIHILLLFIIVAIVQLFIPTQMIFNKETIMETGTAYKFRTQPIDPNDPFRGKYITLKYDFNAIKTEDTLWQRKEKVYVYLTNDSLGFAKPSRITREKLDIDDDYIIAEVSLYFKKSKTVNLNMPFNRYYMEESKAQDAEVAHRIAQRDSLPDNTYALVYVNDGKAVLADVLIDDISIKDYVKDN